MSPEDLNDLFVVADVELGEDIINAQFVNGAEVEAEETCDVGIFLLKDFLVFPDGFFHEDVPVTFR